MIRPLLILSIPLLLTACIFTDPPCVEADYEAQDPIPLQEQRNPQNGACQAFGGGGGGGGGGGHCGDYGGGGAPALEQAPEADVDWAICYQQCEGLDEATCLGTSACRATYLEQWGDQSFYECWGTAPSGPIQGGGCSGLDAQECSRHDDCSAVHTSFEAPGNDGGFINGIGDFQSCIDETEVLIGCYGDSECGEGFHCNASTECMPSPSCGGWDGSGPGESDAPCDTACYGYCVPDVNPNPGSCTGDVLCPTLAPDCPVDTLPGILDGCWSGYCIPVSNCQSVAECPVLGESECVLRSDCDALYQGVDCTCTGETCTCADWLFESCEAGIDVFPAAP